jgi:hypothetical protein
METELLTLNLQTSETIIVKAQFLFERHFDYISCYINKRYP